MDKHLHNIEHLFHDNLQGNEDTPSDAVWDHIDNRLDKEKITKVQKKYTRQKLLSATLVLLLMGLIAYHIFSPAHPVPGKAGATNATLAESKQAADDSLGTASYPAVISPQKAATPKPSPGNENDISNKGAAGSADISNAYINSTSPYKKEKATKAFVTANNAKHTISSKAAKGRINITVTAAAPVTDEPDDNTAVSNIISALPFQPGRLADSIVLLSPENKIKLINTLQPKSFVLDIKNKKAIPVTANIAKAKKYHLTPFFSPDVAWYRLQDDDINGQPDNANKFEQEEEHKFSFTTGIFIDRNLSKHWGLQTGFTVSKTNILVNPKNIYAGPDDNGNVKYRINTSSGYGYVLPSFSANPAVGDSLYAISTNHLLVYIGVPVSLVYTIEKGRFKFSAMAGGGINFLTRARLETRLANNTGSSTEKVDNLQGLKHIYINGLAGLGVEYRLNDKTALAFSPTLRYALGAINNNATVKSYPMSLGFSIGVKTGF